MEPCTNEARIKTVELRTEELHSYFKRMEDKFDAKLDLIIMNLNKVSILEEKHSSQATALERAFSQIRELKLSSEEQTKFKSHTEGMARMAWIIWSAMGASLIGVIIKVFG